MLIRTLFRVALMMLALAPSFAADSGAPGSGGTADVTVAGLKSGEGMLFVSLYLNDEGYPGDWAKAFASRRVPASEAVDGKMELTFEDVPPGPLVVTVIHDANGDGKLSTNFLGIPKEAYGFSNNAKSLFGPPKFEDATLDMTAGETLAVRIDLK